MKKLKEYKSCFKLSEDQAGDNLKEAIQIYIESTVNKPGGDPSLVSLALLTRIRDGVAQGLKSSMPVDEAKKWYESFKQYYNRNKL